MKFIKRHINEGYFGNVKDPNKSSNNTIAKIGVDALNAKVPEIKEILRKAIFDTFGPTYTQHYSVDNKPIECMFIIPNIAELDKFGERWKDEEEQIKYNFIKSINYVPGEGYVAKIYVYDFSSEFRERVLYLGKGVEEFVNKLNTVERIVERAIKTPLTIQLVRLKDLVLAGWRAVDEKYDTEFPFPKGISCCIIAKDINFEKLYELFGKFETLSGEVITNKLIITGENTLSSLNDLPPLPFKTHEILFTDLANFLPISVRLDAADTLAPQLTELGNYRRFLDSKNYPGAWGDVIHPTIGFILSSYTADDIDKIIGGAIPKEKLKKYINSQLSSGRPKRHTYFKYNPYTNQIEKS